VRSGLALFVTEIVVAVVSETTQVSESCGTASNNGVSSYQLSIAPAFPTRPRGPDKKTLKIEDEARPCFAAPYRRSAIHGHCGRDSVSDLGRTAALDSLEILPFVQEARSISENTPK
jgi:hypothetical protein